MTDSPDAAATKARIHAVLQARWTDREVRLFVGPCTDERKRPTGQVALAYGMLPGPPNVGTWSLSAWGEDVDAAWRNLARTVGA